MKQRNPFYLAPGVLEVYARPSWLRRLYLALLRRIRPN